MGKVYAVFVSLGFALWENISYVLHFGFQTAIVRSLTAIPGHACFGVFMGAFTDWQEEARIEAKPENQNCSERSAYSYPFCCTAHTTILPA